MRFHLVDRILDLTSGERIVTVKSVSLAEDYLADHFPTFPVLPGVLMLEVMAESAAWLVRESRDFAPMRVLLREARNVTYKSFVKPGNLLRVEVTCRKMESGTSDYEGAGFRGETEVVRARFGLRHEALPLQGSELATARTRQRFAALFAPERAGNEPDVTSAGRLKASDSLVP